MISAQTLYVCREGKPPRTFPDHALAQRPRETRSISALTMRCTSPGKLSSSQDFSIGRSISLTRSSSVRALLLSTVWARLLKADSTADTVERDSIGWDATGLSTC